MKFKIFLIVILGSLNIGVNAQDIYNSEQYGLSFTPPKNWSVLNHKQSSSDPSNSHGKTLVSYYKNPNNIDEKINPTLQVYVVRNNFKTVEAFKKKMTRRNYNKQLINFSIKKKPELVTINGNLGSFETSTYTFINKKDDYLFVKRRRYVFFTKETLIYVSLIDERENEQNTTILNELVNSLKMRK